MGLVRGKSKKKQIKKEPKLGSGSFYWGRAFGNRDRMRVERSDQLKWGRKKRFGLSRKEGGEGKKRKNLGRERYEKSII